MTTEELNVIITAQNKEFNKRLDEVNGQLDTLGKKAEKSAQSTSSAFRSMAAVLSSLGIAKLLGDLNKAYTVQMMNETKLETVMRNRIGATEEEIASVKRLTAAQQQIGIIGDEIQLAGAQQLATFATSTKTIETLIPAMNNLMAQQNGFSSTESSAVSVANLMGKALNGQASALTRVGITFNAAQEQVLKYGTEAQRAATLAEVITQNVGNMNKALRGTTQGELQALKNDFGDLKEEIGATFQPLLGVLIPMASDGLQALRPYVGKLEEGFRTVSEWISTISPRTMSVIKVTVSAALAVTAVTKATQLLTLAKAGYSAVLSVLIPKQLTFTTLLRSAAGWIGILAGAIALFGIISDIKNSSDISAEALDAQEESANTAAEGVGNLSDSVGELGETTKKSLAAVDKLNIIGGGNGNIIGVDTEGIISAAADIGSLKEDIDEVTGQDYSIDMSLNFDLKELGVKLNDLWNGISTGFKQMINGDFYGGLKTMDSAFGRFFGESWEDWSGFWQDIGKGINQMVNGDFYGGMQTMDTAFRRFFGEFGEAWSDFWFNAGVGLQELNAKWSDFFQGYGSYMYELLNGDKIQMNELASKYSTLNSDMNDAIIEKLKQGQSAEDALEATKAELLTTSEMVYYYNNGGIAKTLSDVQRWQNNLIESGQLYDYADYSDLSTALRPAFSGAEQQSVGGLRNLRDTNNSERGIPPINLTVVSELDGEKVGEFSRNYLARDLARSNGY